MLLVTQCYSLLHILMYNKCISVCIRVWACTQACECFCMCISYTLRTLILCLLLVRRLKSTMHTLNLQYLLSVCYFPLLLYDCVGLIKNLLRRTTILHIFCAIIFVMQNSRARSRVILHNLIVLVCFT